MASIREILRNVVYGPPTPAEKRARESAERRAEAEAQFNDLITSQTLHLANASKRITENYFGFLGSSPDFTPYGPGGYMGLGSPGVGFTGGRQTYDNGRDATAYATEVELLHYRELSRILYRWNDFAGGAIDRLVEYTTGKGYTWTVRRRGQKTTASDNDRPPDVANAQAGIDQFRRLDKWRTRAQEIVRRFHRDGEAAVRVFRQDVGKLPIIRQIEPEHITCPPSQSGVDHWSFGVLNEPGDIESRLAVFVCPSAKPDQGEVVPFPGVDLDRVRELSPGLRIGRGVVLLLAGNVDRTVKRGIPSMLASRDGLERARKLLRNVLDTAAYQASIGMIRTHQQGTERTITDFTKAKASGSVAIPNIVPGMIGSPPPARPANAVTAAGGTHIFDATDALSYSPGPVSTGTPSFLQAVQAQVRGVAVREAMPEYMATGDASNGNFASTKEAGTPFVVSRESDQLLFAEFECDVATVILNFACDSSAISANADELEIEVTPPGVAMQSDVEKEQVNDIRLRNRTASPQEIIRQRGGDVEQVVNDLQSWDERFPDAAGKLPELKFDDPPPDPEPKP